MNRLALADPVLLAPRSYPELTDRRVFVGGGCGELGALAAHAFAAQDCRMVLQGDQSVTGLAGELEGVARSVRAFRGEPDDVQAAARLGEAALKAHSGLDVAVLTLDLTARGMASALAACERSAAREAGHHDAPLEIGAVFETVLTMAETIAERMARAGGGTIAYVASVERFESGNPLATLARVGLEEIMASQMEDWEDAGVRFVAVTLEDADDDQAALELTGALLLTASGRGEWLEGAVVSL
ncbi:MAG: hypothetical protein GC150_03785 [Rhizobiales bacterium]|nr:hypothetical protein [Hyphomicrobiales bacterium]